MAEEAVRRRRVLTEPETDVTYDTDTDTMPQQDWA